MVGGVDDDVGGHCTLLCISVLKLDWLMITQSEKLVRLKCGSSTEYKLQVLFILKGLSRTLYYDKNDILYSAPERI